MRGVDSKQEGMFSYVSPESRIPTNHPLRPIRAVVAEALTQMDRKLESLHSQNGRPSIAPERLIRALLLQVLYTSAASGCWSSNSNTSCCFAGS